MENKEYKILKEEVCEFLQKIKIDINSKLAPTEKFLGYRVFYSPLIINPAILFIGINPGSGQACEWLDPEECFEYIKYDFTLAKETKQVFKDIGFGHMLENNAVKINYYYLITTTERELYRLTNRINPLLGRQFYINSADWTKRIIALINPRIIICEGKRAYDKVTELYPGNETKLNDSWLYEIPEKRLIVVGYKRRYSNIKNKGELSTLLHELLSKI